ncbi:MAG TPA: 2-dehydropantoate 2-reductase [Candidatus Limnocylindria bacterium]|nr:2-dehydropantoate 2-reductase [Candidatus Limnocylindria bacterium]
MKIAIVGCGALGSYYGAKLCRDGQEVHFLLRSDYDVVRRRGVFIRSPEGDFHVNPRCARTPEQIGLCDVVLIGLKATANDAFPKLLPPLVEPNTAIVTLQNGLGNEEQLAKIFPPSQILGGLCFVCLNRLEPGVIQHLAHGRIVLGEFSGWPEPRTHDVATAIRHSGVPCEVTDNLRRTHWQKLVWNIPFNGLGVASAAGYEAVVAGELNPNAPLTACFTTDKLLDETRWKTLVRELMLEVIATANAMGLHIAEDYAEFQIARTRDMGAYRASTLIDFERGQTLELEALFLEPLRQARAAGVTVPRLTALCAVLSRLDARRQS